MNCIAAFFTLLTLASFLAGCTRTGNDTLTGSKGSAPASNPPTPPPGGQVAPNPTTPKTDQHP